MEHTHTENLLFLNTVESVKSQYSETMVIQTMGNYLSILAWTSQFSLSFSLPYMTCSKTIHMYLTDTLILGMKTWQKSKVFLSFQLSSFPAMMINCSGSRKMRDKEVEKCFTQLSLMYRWQWLKLHWITPKKTKTTKKPKKQTTHKTNAPPQKNKPKKKESPKQQQQKTTNTHTQKKNNTKASKFYVSHFWWLIKGRRFFFHKFRSFVTYKAVF